MPLSRCGAGAAPCGAESRSRLLYPARDSSAHHGAAASLSRLLLELLRCPAGCFPASLLARWPVGPLRLRAPTRLPLTLHIPTHAAGSTLTEDSAARAFLVGFLTQLAAEHERERSALLPLPWTAAADGADGAPGLVGVRRAFEAGCASFSREGFRFGDPSTYLHPPHHEHWRRPQFATCRGCLPPVQGRVVLLHTPPGGRSGEIEEIYGRDAIGRDERSWTRRWRVLLLGTRLASTKDWRSTNEVVRDLHRAHLREHASDGAADLATLAGRAEPHRSPVRRQRSCGEIPAAPLLHPEVGLASQMAQPGGFRRAHVRATRQSGHSAMEEQARGRALSSGACSDVATGAAARSTQQAHASRPLSLRDEKSV